MQQFGGKDSKRHFTIVIGNKEHGLYVSSTPSSAAKKAVTKLCAANKSKKVEFHIRETTQGSKKKTYGPYTGYIEKLKEPIELKSRVIMHKPVAKLSAKSGAKKGGRMKGGGYTGRLSVNKNIGDILLNYHDNDITLNFTIENIETKENIIYQNIKYLGAGTYGKIFLIHNTSDGKNYIIKIFSNYIDEYKIESNILNSFMNTIELKCQYKSISQGETVIDSRNISYIIFPFKGDLNLLKVINEGKFKIIPKILSDVISCLININQHASHGDLKLENIAYNSDTKIGFIIDYGLSITFPIALNNMNEITIGNMQISFDIIIAYLLKIKFSNKSSININKINRLLENLYSNCLLDVEKTIDNFGLFWLIINCISIRNIKDRYLSNSEFIIDSKNISFIEEYLNFYFNLDNIEIEESKVIKDKLIRIFQYQSIPSSKQEFIDYVRTNISPEKFAFYFKSNEQFYSDFIEKVIALVRVDPKTRIPKEVLLQDPFFSLLPPKNASPNSPPP
jgi:serine/threonine protein kinase